MTRIDFYILQESASETRWLFTCRLVEKAVRSGHKVLITTDSIADAQHLDDLLWTFKPETFIPHELVGLPRVEASGVEASRIEASRIEASRIEASSMETSGIEDTTESDAVKRAALAPVVITTGLADHQLHEHHGLLINLAQEIPAWFSRFERVSEIVIQQPDILKNTREHFSFYRERGYPIKHYKM